MIRRLVAVAVVSVALGGLAASLAGAKTPPIQATCTGGTGLDVYFWPQGHPAVPALGFPSFATPHVEVYRARSAANDAQLGYLDRTQYAVARTCASAGTDVSATAIGSPVTATDQQKIRCSFSGAIDLRFSALSRTTTRVVKRPVIVTVHGKKRRKLVNKRLKITQFLGTRVTARAAGGATILSVEVTATPRVTWDSRACAAVPLAG